MQSTSVMSRSVSPLIRVSRYHSDLRWLKSGTLSTRLVSHKTCLLITISSQFTLPYHRTKIGVSRLNLNLYSSCSASSSHVANPVFATAASTRIQHGDDTRTWSWKVAYFTSTKGWVSKLISFFVWHAQFYWIIFIIFLFYWYGAENLAGGIARHIQHHHYNVCS